MPTQISYKGETLASFTNATKTMLTAGKYLEDDITIIASEQTDIPIGIVKSNYDVTLLGLTWVNTAEEGS